MGHSELLAEYETRKARVRAHYRAKEKQRGAQLDFKDSSQSAGDDDITAGQLQKRPRGRPQKVLPATVY